MKPYFECSDKLNKPYEAFLFDAQTSEMFPILPHWHYFVEILYMVEGNAYVEAGEENYVLEPGDLILFYPQMAHAIYSTGQLPIRYYVLKFDVGQLSPSAGMPGSRADIHFSSLFRAARGNPASKLFFRSDEMTDFVYGVIVE